MLRVNILKLPMYKESNINEQQFNYSLIVSDSAGVCSRINTRPWQ
jgi:hypothetical protein